MQNEKHASEIKKTRRTYSVKSEAQSGTGVTPGNKFLQSENHQVSLHNFFLQMGK